MTESTITDYISITCFACSYIFYKITNNILYSFFVPLVIYFINCYLAMKLGTNEIGIWYQFLLIVVPLGLTFIICPENINEIKEHWRSIIKK